MPTDADRLATEVFGELVRVVHLVGQAGARELRGHDLTPAQYQLMVLVQERPGLLQREICEALGVTKGNTSQLVSRLEEAGLLRRDPSGAANQVALTDRGDRLVGVLRPAHHAFLARCFTPLDPTELQQLSRLLSRISASL